VIATIEGKAENILIAERVALNFMSHISGITTKTNQFVKLVNNKCKICLVSFTTLKPHNIHVDHCHTKKTVRKLLCQYCNTGLGQFKDNIKIMKRAVEYLKQFK
jgi:hypothetical protein